MSADRLLWFDLETTGLEPDRHVILEVGAQLTDDNADLNVHDTRSWYVNPWPRSVPADAIAHAQRLAGDYVREMHRTSGLWADMYLNVDSLQPAEDVEKTLVDWLDGAGQVALAGTGVAHFDLPWLAVHMPTLHARLHYASVDVGHVRRSLEIVAPHWHAELDRINSSRDDNHRALADAQAARAQMLALRRLIQGDQP